MAEGTAVRGSKRPLPVGGGGGDLSATQKEPKKVKHAPEDGEITVLDENRKGPPLWVATGVVRYVRQLNESDASNGCDLVGLFEWRLELNLSCTSVQCCALPTSQRPCLQPESALKRGLRCWLTPVGPLVTQTREFRALQTLEDRLGGGQNFPYHHHQQQQQQHCQRTLLQSLLRPQQIASLPWGHWPQALVSPYFHRWLHQTFDLPQVKAIERSAGFLGAQENVLITGPGHHQQQQQQQQQQQSVQPFTLIQGPPGTGKTHTVKGILNVWHLVSYQRHYASLESALRFLSLRAHEQVEGGDQYEQRDVVERSVDQLLEWVVTDDALDSTNKRSTCAPARDMNVSALPRILVCAPSNAAIDEILERILQEGFQQIKATGGGQSTYRGGGDTNHHVAEVKSRYWPHVVRVGSTDAPISDRARDVFIDSQIDALLHQTVEQHASAVAAVETDLDEASKLVAELRARLVGRWRPNPQTSSPVSTTEESASIRIPRLLAEAIHTRRRHLQRRRRLELVRGSVYGEEGFRIRDVRERLEANFLREATLVFTTLSATGRRNLTRLGLHFPMVLIDEACQASEPATLQPLTLLGGVEHVVMVGDPQQLPATVLSVQAARLRLERSLFERLQQCGVPVTVLAVQYRMHPQIRYFPSQHFYQGELTDAPSVVSTPDECFYHSPLLQPYRVFDVARGKEERGRGPESSSSSSSLSPSDLSTTVGSLFNREEAQVALGLYLLLREEIRRARDARGDPNSVNPPPRYRVGVVTPYRQQRDVMRRLFDHIVTDPEERKTIKIETVDSFQGKQLDVVILSCVRASSSRTEVEGREVVQKGQDGSDGGEDKNSDGPEKEEEEEEEQGEGQDARINNAKSADGGTGTTSIGFVADVRRTNVAITRAKRALWIVANLRTLSEGSDTWRALAADAERRGAVVRDTTLDTILPPEPTKDASTPVISVRAAQIKDAWHNV